MILNQFSSEELLVGSKEKIKTTFCSTINTSSNFFIVIVRDGRNHSAFRNGHGPYIVLVKQQSSKKFMVNNE